MAEIINEGRKLASIQTIAEIKPIEGADRIVAYRVGGWWIVDAKDKYKVSDSVVMCEVDSFVPTEVAPFLTKPEHFPREFLGVKGERLRTIKLKGQLSQGLLLPMSILPNNEEVGVGFYIEGEDVTNTLGILKWEKPLPACLAGTARGNFPSFIPKTDQERVQNLSKQIEEMQGELFEVTIKLDGSSCTIFVNREDNGVCSRNLELKQTDTNAFWQIAVEEDVHAKIRSTGRNLALQGELIGPSIQGNYEKVTSGKNEYYVYDVFDIDKQAYLLPEERLELVQQLGLKHIPIITGSQILSHNVQQLLDMAEGEGMNKGVKREGLVFKHLHSDFSFKAISNSYLLKEK